MHCFKGEWITDGEFYCLEPRNVFGRELDRLEPDCTEHLDRHILFRKDFEITGEFEKAQAFITADDYYKLYINGRFVTQGPAPCYSRCYNYNTVDVSQYLREGVNTVAVHTLYQGLINRVWQSGDNRHGFIMDLELDGENVLKSDESFKTAVHSGYNHFSTVGYDTQFLEQYDSGSAYTGFERPDYDYSFWENARLHTCNDRVLTEQRSKQLVFERIDPAEIRKEEKGIFVDFGKIYVGYLCARVRGNCGDKVILRQAQELEEDSTLRFRLRANCVYEEPWILGEGTSELDWFDYKSFRYAFFEMPEGAELEEVYFNARHYPFELKADLRDEYKGDARLEAIWELCVNSQRYGVQEVIQDCMEREKGFYLGDGCYTALTHLILSGDDSMARKLIDDAFESTFICDTAVTCMDCSFVQEIAEFPLIMVFLILWHYRVTGDLNYLACNYEKAKKLVDAYRAHYEKDCLIGNLDKWCVVEWPDNFRDGYDVDISAGKICKEPHAVMNSYYIEAVRTLNKAAKILGKEEYRDEKPLVQAFIKAFYDKERHLFTDSAVTSHTSLISNCFAFAFSLCPDSISEENTVKMITERGISDVSMFTAFPVLMGLARRGNKELIRQLLCDEGAWLRMLREGATTTFESWGKETKRNTSLFHLTLSYAAVFLSDTDLNLLFE